MRHPSLRFCLLVLELLFTLVLNAAFGFADSTAAHQRVLAVVSILTLAIACAPQALLRKPWTVPGLALGNAAVLMHVVFESQTIEPWLPLGYVLVMLMALYSVSLLQLVGLASALCAAYGFSIVRFSPALAEHALVIPVLGAMVMVYSTKETLVRAELERLVETKEKTRHETMRDALTGLPNRAQFVECVWRAIRCAKSNRDFLFGVLFVDLDGFKPINDGLGHKAGDAVLAQTARRLQGCLRKGDVVARYGGDEFTLLINNVTGESDVMRVADRILRKITEPIHVGQRVQVGASIGIALSTNLHDTPEDLIRDADAAMYRAKSRGKGQYEISDQRLDSKGALKDMLRRKILPQA